MHPHSYECMLAAGARHSVAGDDLALLDAFLVEHKSWVFGHFSYQLKDQLHGLTTSNQDRIGFPSFHFFAPEILMLVNADGISIHADDPDQVFSELMSEATTHTCSDYHLNIRSRMTREEYILKIKKLQEHILRGDCYEINFCLEFFAEEAEVDPVDVYHKLINISPNPYSAFYRLNNSYLMCASPERYLARKGDTILSQPIKGTIRRNLQNKTEDERLKAELGESAKDQSENVMVVDMVRNDLTRICKDASVQVDELFGIYSFPQVHQMISTISGEMKSGIKISEILEATFPMGSMTGAPKFRVMELIDEYEMSARGIFSGSVGYFDPDRNFDFNVVIRSIMYNEGNHYLSYQLGSGITFYSNPEMEWEECLLKGEAIRKVLQNFHTAEK